jgi:pimeloyl-ACP methyl ester carboxylesterase
MSIQHLNAHINLPNSSESLRIAYLHTVPNGNQVPRGTIVLLHGYPQTSYQYRHVLPLLSAAGYRCIAPDYRGAGDSSYPRRDDWRKTTMAKDIIALLDHLHIFEPIHLIGHDIGGKIAFALATRHAERFRCVVWGENILPGTEAYTMCRTVPEQTVLLFHFIFHCVSPLAEALVEGKEKLYVQHFFQKLCYNRDAFPDEVVQVYAHAYAQPGAMKCAMGIYKAFDEDHRENQEWIKNNGKCSLPTLLLNGEKSLIADQGEAMGRQVTEADKIEMGVVEGAGHYIAEENPEGFAEQVLGFLNKY